MPGSTSGGVSAWRRGIATWFNGEEGFGFIAPDDGTPDVLVHCAEISGTRPQLSAGRAVSSTRSTRTSASTSQHARNFLQRPRAEDLVPPVHVPRVRDDGTGTITTTDGESLTGLFFGPSFFATHILAFERNVVSSRRLRIPDRRRDLPGQDRTHRRTRRP
ncbi:cold shock domain-containing protein [Rhodococcus opacus]|uniref:cold shock domain-containing protein n=1 Tax=Rhodococcus opacus TaxID=37919 RepID=UPI0009E9067C